MIRDAETVLLDIDNNQKIADTDLDSISHRNLPGFQVAVRQAKDFLAQLKDEYRDVILPRLVGVFINGDNGKINELSKLVFEEGGVVIDSQKLYVNIADRILPTIGGSRVFQAQQTALLVEYIRQIGLELDIPSMNTVKYKEVVILDKKDVTLHIKSLVREAVGDELIVKLLKKEIVDNCIKAGVCSKYIPVLVTGASVDEVNGIGVLFKHSSQEKVFKDEEISKEYAIRLFKKARLNK
jgi:hypothetical protein